MAATQVLRLRRDAGGLSSDGSGVLVYSLASSKKRKKSRGLSFAEKLVRRSIRAHARGSAEYLDRHDRSSRKRRDGWARDLPVNVFKARRKGMKELNLGRLIF